MIMMVLCHLVTILYSDVRQILYMPDCLCCLLGQLPGGDCLVNCTSHRRKLWEYTALLLFTHCNLLVSHLRASLLPTRNKSFCNSINIAVLCGFLWVVNNHIRLEQMTKIV
jgi:hypothetical protein